MRADDEELNAASARQVQAARAQRAVLTVDLGAIAANVQLVRRLCPRSRVMAILKGDAYGIGAAAVARHLELDGVPAFGVDNVGEGLALRQAGIRGRILVLDGCIPDNAATALTHALEPGIATVKLLEAYERAAQRRGERARIWLYYNCGFNRAGPHDALGFRALLDAAAGCRWLEVVALYTHLTESHDCLEACLRQAAAYEQALRLARRVLGDDLESSLLASHGILKLHNAVQCDWVRPGILLYGAECFTPRGLHGELAALIETMRPALGLRARLIHKLFFATEQAIGYGRGHRTRPGQTLGTVAVGFGHGLPQTPGAACYRQSDRDFPVVAPLGMDYSQVDLSAAADTELYTWFSLFGEPRRGERSLKQFASMMGMNPYVLMRQLNVARRYVDAEAE